MENNLIDLRWFLLTHIENINNILIWQKIIFTLSFIFFSFCSLSPFFVNHNSAFKRQKYWLKDVIFIISLIILIIVGRWTELLDHSIVGPDEELFIAAATKLVVDPFFWKSIDTGSSGPLNIFVLLIPKIFGFKIEYASARIIGLICILISTISLYFSLKFIYNKLIARSSTFLIVICFATLKSSDFFRYSSEYVSITILSLVLMIICYGYSKANKNNLWIFFSGLLLGLIPYAKFQAVPIALALAIITIHIIWQKSQTKHGLRNNFAIFGAALLLGSGLVFFYLLVFSVFDDFYKSYILQNLLFYSSSSSKHVNPNFLLNFKLHFLFMIGWYEKSTRFLFILSLGFIYIFIYLFRFYYTKNRFKQFSKTFPFVYYSLFILIMAIYAVSKPGNLFSHYLLLLIIPCGFFIGVCLGEMQDIVVNSKSNKTPLIILKIFLISTIISGFILSGITINTNNRYLAARKELVKNYQDPVAIAINKYAFPGQTIVVWGWASELYVQTGTIQGVRDGFLMWQIIPSPQQKYFRKRFLDDFIKSKATVFVDAVSPKMFFFHDYKTQGHEAFPEVAKVIHERYKLVEEVNGVRIYTLHPY